MFTKFIGDRGSTNIQHFNWGTVSWLHEPDYSGSERLSIGMVVFYPYKNHDIHTHTGEEQVMLCLEGTGEHIIDNKKTTIEPGMVIYCPPFCDHEVSNKSDKPLKLLIIYSPSRQTELNHRVSTVIDDIDDIDIRDYIDENTISILQNNFFSTLGFPVIILDKSKLPISEAGFPKYCREKFCLNGEHCYKNHLKNIADEKIFDCCNGLKCVCSAVKLGDASIGYILSGFLVSDQHKEKPELLESLRVVAEPIRRIYALMHSISHVSDWLSDVILNSIIENKMTQKNQRLAEEIKGRAELENALINARQQLMKNNLKIDTMVKSRSALLNSVEQHDYPIEVEKKIIKALHEYNEGEIQGLVNEFYDMLGLNELSQYKASFSELLISVLKTYDYDNKIYNSLRANIIKKINECNNKASLLECARASICSINSYIDNEESSQGVIVKKVIKHIDNNYEKKLTLETLSDIVHISPNYLSNLFKDNTGMNISDYIINIRLNKAKQLLLNTKLEIRDIASRVGYGDVSYFCQLFKKKEGVSPNKYRK